MSKLKVDTIRKLYHKDEQAWIKRNLLFLKEGNTKLLDVENLIEFLSEFSASQEREVFSRLSVLITHLLKWKFQSKKQSRSWQSTIREQRKQLALIFGQSKTLGNYGKSILKSVYKDATEEAAFQTHLPATTFPIELPWQWEQILDIAFYP